MILKTNIYLLTINVFILMIPYMSCDCGPFGYTVHHELHEYRNVSSENSEIDYSCPVYYSMLVSISDKKRNCIKGKWNRRVPKCGKYKTIKLNKNIDYNLLSLVNESRGCGRKSFYRNT
jgi:hypothetical protein